MGELIVNVVRLNHESEDVLLLKSHYLKIWETNEKVKNSPKNNRI